MSLSTSLPQFDPSQLQTAQQRLESEIEFRRQKKIQAKRGGLIEFVRYFWDVLEPQTPLVEGWALEAICEHLEAVTFGEITRLLINVPPGFMKSMLTDVLWPAFEWGPMGMSHLRYVTFSYSASLTERDNGRFRDLINSAKYRKMWGDKFELRTIGVTRVANDKTGWKLASSVGGVGTGERGDRVLADDLHNIKESESEVVRTETVRWFQEAAENRLNSLETGCIVVIMQRVHELDVAGAIIIDGRYDHLMIPMEFETGRACETAIGWHDPRTEEGELAWPQRFNETTLQTFKKRPYMWAGQYQQRPEPRGGGIFKHHWWNCWTDETAAKYGVKPGHLPQMAYVLGILDTAYTEKTSNDPSAMTVLGVWHDPQGVPQVMLSNAWEEWLEFNPLVEKVAQTCTDSKVDRLLVEAKASGISVAQELQRRYSNSGWGLELFDPGKGDKISRAYAVTHVFEDGAMWAPGYDDGAWRTWVDKVVTQMGTFPKAAHDDLTDTVTAGLKYLRDCGLLKRKDEHARDVTDAMTFRGREQPLYHG